MGSVQNVAAIFLLVGGSLNVEGIQAVTTLGEKVNADSLTLQKRVDQWLEVRAVVEIAGECANGQVDLCGEDGEQAIIKRDDGIQMHFPELWGHR